MFENKKVKVKVKVRGTQTIYERYKVHVSILIASWRNAGGQHYRGAFEEWLKTLGLDYDTACEISNIANTGTFELETDAEQFIKSYDPINYYDDCRALNMDEDFIKLYEKTFERNYKIP